MIKVTLELHDARRVRPEKSGTYMAIVLGLSGYAVYDLPYSKKHDAFNMRDDYKSSETAIEVDYWCELPEIPGREEEN